MNAENKKDKILTIFNWWDGAICGICTFQGEFCFYERIFSEEIDDFSDFYYLTPISESDAQASIDAWKQGCISLNNGEKMSASDSTTSDPFNETPKDSPHYREFKKQAFFSGVFYSPTDENISEHYFVEWK